MSNEEHRKKPEGEHPEETSGRADDVQGTPADPREIPETESEGTVEEPVGAEPGVVAEEEISALSLELERTRRERDEYLDALQRLKAEFDNARKRQQRELARVTEAAAFELVAELLPVLDNLDRALEAEGDIREGVRATRDQLISVLEKEGLAPVATDGQQFDPNVHEAVMSQPSEEHEEGTVLQTFQRGYLFNGRPLRPAKVVVAHQG
ncbi:MAG: nucleotide exchange factor GrpE [Actinomycetota bacterium]